MLQACGRHEAPASREFRLQREGLEKDFSPVLARSRGPRAARRGERTLTHTVFLGSHFAARTS